jgi:hypothetical protein
MDIPYSTFDFSNIMSFPISDKAMIDEFVKPVGTPRHMSNHKWTRSLATILAILLFCSFVGTVLDVHVGKSISRQVSTEENRPCVAILLILTCQIDFQLDGYIIDKRDDVPMNITIELVPHPVYYNVHTLPMIYPNTTAMSNTTSLEKRYNWWALGGYFEMALAGVGIWTLAASCKAWYDDGSENTSAAGKTGCVIGALSTLMIVSGAGVAAATWGSRVGLTLAILNQHTNVKRDLASPEVTQILIDYQTTMVNATRLAMYPMFNETGDLMLHSKSGMPLMFGYTPAGDGMVFTHAPHDGTNMIYMAYGFVPPPSATGKRDTYCNEEEFTCGGLEAGFFREPSIRWGLPQCSKRLRADGSPSVVHIRLPRERRSRIPDIRQQSPWNNRIWKNQSISV